MGYNSFKDKSKQKFNVITILAKYVSQISDRFLSPPKHNHKTIIFKLKYERNCIKTLSLCV